MPQDQRAPNAPLLPLFPPIEPYASGMLDLDAPHRMYYEQSGNPAGVPVVFLHGGPGAGASAGAPPVLRSRVLPHRGPRPARRRPLDAAGLPREQHHARADRRPRAAAPAPGHRALARVRRLVGLDARARLRRAPSGALPRRWCCAASSSAGQSEIDWFLYGMRDDLPGGLARLRRLHSRSRARRPARRAYHRRLTDPDPGGAHAGGALLERLRGLVLDAAAQSRRWWRTSPPTAWRSASRASRRTTSATTSSCRTNFLLDNVGAAEAHSRASSCRGATTSCARRSRPTTCTARGPRRSTSRPRCGALRLRAGHPLAARRRHRGLQGESDKVTPLRYSEMLEPSSHPL